MSQSTLDPRYTAGPPKKRITLSWNDPVLRSIFWQVVIIGVIVGIVWYLAHNTATNLADRRIATGYGFLDRIAGIPIGEHLIDYEPSINSFGRALWVGVLNTLQVAVVGIVLATLLGTLIGIARLSRNWLLSRLALTYVEVIRDIPLLLQLFFWYGIVQTLPIPRQALNPVPGLFFSNRGIRFGELIWQPAHSAALVALLIGACFMILVNRRASRLQESTGQRPKVWPWAVGLLVALPVAIWAAMGAPFAWELPVLRGFNFQGGGTFSPEFGALLMGLVIYTAAYIAEIVRSGIQAVPGGQVEAAGALGMRPGLVLRMIVLPQALRVIIPPMTSQFLNLTKNSSLAVAIGFQDFVSIANTTLNQTGQAIEVIALIMLVYLTISLSISIFMNWYNKRIALVER